MHAKISKLLLTAVASAVLACSAYSSNDRPNRIGGGIHYWKTIDQLKKEHKSIDDDGIAWVVSYQRVISMLKLEADLEIFPNGYGGSEDTAFSPQAFIGLGSAIYAAIGIGTVYASDLDKTFSDPLFIGRAGLDLEIIPALHLDINANYYFAKWEDWDDFDTDTITLGGQVRLAF